MTGQSCTSECTTTACFRDAVVVLEGILIAPTRQDRRLIEIHIRLLIIQVSGTRRVEATMVRILCILIYTPTPCTPTSIQIKKSQLEYKRSSRLFGWPRIPGTSGIIVEPPCDTWSRSVNPRLKEGAMGRGRDRGESKRGRGGRGSYTAPGGRNGGSFGGGGMLRRGLTLAKNVVKSATNIHLFWNNGDGRLCTSYSARQ